jgi:hypothetical protein
MRTRRAILVVLADVIDVEFLRDQLNERGEQVVSVVLLQCKETNGPSLTRSQITRCT